MTNLSKELCKICDIDSKIKCRPYECDQVGTVVRDKCPADFSPNEKCLQHKDNTTAYYSYPDFTKPENFVKLEEIMLAELAKQRLTVVKWVHYFSDVELMHEYILITKCGHKTKFTHTGIHVDNWFVEREDRTECLILFILWKVLPICGESIKQAIKSVDWKYD